MGGGVVLRADHVLWPFWSRTILRAILKTLLVEMCQFCDAGLKSQNGVGQGAADLTTAS